jgi:hypothetical protein
MISSARLFKVAEARFVYPSNPSSPKANPHPDTIIAINSNSPDSKMPATTVIDKRGDVILHVGEGKEDAVSLLVSSHVLGLASSVFEAMFEGRFAEGQNLSTTSPPTITFPDDHPKYMTFLCKLFHLQTDDIPGTLEISGLVELAVLCDKYDCAKGVRPWSKIWVSQHLSTPESHGFQQLLAVSFVLDLPHEFREVSVGLIRSYQHLDKTALAVNGHDYLPMVVIGTCAFFSLNILLGIANVSSQSVSKWTIPVFRARQRQQLYHRL